MMNKKAIKILKYFFKQGIKILQWVLLYFWRLSLCKMATSSRLYSTTFSVIVVGWSSVLESKNKNIGDGFHCMRMILVMSVWFSFGDDWNNAKCLSRFSFLAKFFLLCIRNHALFFFRQNRLRFMLIWHNKAIKSQVQNRHKLKVKTVNVLSLQTYF